MVRVRPNVWRVAGALALWGCAVWAQPAPERACGDVAVQRCAGGQVPADNERCCVCPAGSRPVPTGGSGSYLCDRSAPPDPTPRCRPGERVSRGHCCAEGSVWSVSAGRCQTAAPAPATPACPEGMTLVAAGEFDRGTPIGEGDDDERPVQRVRVSAFCIDRTEATVGQFRAYWSSGRAAGAGAPGTDAWCNWTRDPDARESHPINCIDWNTARAYCASRSLRLPTEAEWEYAARGADGRRFPWGNAAPTESLVCWSGATGREGTCPVGQLARGASPFGAFDMAGNVWEWTADPYVPSYVSGRAGEAARGSERVLRGGSWGDVLPEDVRSADRARLSPDAQRPDVGVRCVRGGPATAP